MTKNLQTLLEAAKKVVLTEEEKEQQRLSFALTEEEKEEQRRSFAYGNTKIENSRITREMVDRAADAIEHRKGEQSHRSE